MLQLAAKDDVHLQSQLAGIDLAAAKRIKISEPGGASITIADGGIVIEGPGTATVYASKKSFVPGQFASYAMPSLPKQAVEKTSLQFRFAYHDGESVPGAAYRATFVDGSVRKGNLDADGRLHVDAIDPGTMTIELGPDPRPYQRFKLSVHPDDDASTWMGAAP